MPQLTPVPTATSGFLPAPITDEEARAMVRACLKLFRRWKIADTEAATLLDLQPLTFAR